MTHAPYYEKLKGLRDHILSMDTGSEDAKVLTWAISMIDRLYDLDEPIEGPDR